MTLTVQGGKVHLVDEGRGTPTLFLHGNPDSADVWRGVIADMKGEYRCLAPDLPGFGRSEALPHLDPSGDGVARWVDDLVTAIGITEPLNLVVHDFGGPFGLAWAAKYPQKIKSIAVLNTVFHGSYRWHFWGRVWRTPILGELSMMVMSRFAMRQEMRRGSPTLTNEQIDETYALMSPAMKQTVLKLYRATDPAKLGDWEQRLLAVTAQVPTIVVWGDLDPYIPSHYADRFGARRVRHFKQWGHWMQMESPHEVADELLAFFGEHAQPMRKTG